MPDLSPLPPVIDLDGVRLRPLRADDAADLFAYLSDPAVTERTAFPDITPTLVAGMIEKYQRRWAAGELSKWAVTLPPDDRPVGTCGFNDWSAAHRWAELAYDLARPHWGTGLMRRAVAAVLRWSFGLNQIDRVHAYVRVDNERSGRLLERLGFQREGRLRNFRICRGRPHDFDIYGLLRSEWESLSSSL